MKPHRNLLKEKEWLVTIRKQRYSADDGIFSWEAAGKLNFVITR
jgi:hypothetical protein